MAQSEKIDLQVEQLRGLCDSIKPCLDSIHSSHKKGEVKNQVENAIHDLERILKTMEYPQSSIADTKPGTGSLSLETMYNALDLSPLVLLVVKRGIIQFANKKATQYFELSNNQKIEGTHLSTLIDYRPVPLNGYENTYQVTNLNGNIGNDQKPTFTLTTLDEAGTLLITFDEAYEEIYPSSTRLGQEKMEYLLEESPSVMYSADHIYPHAVSYMSANIRSISGHTVESFTKNGSFWADHIHKDDVKEVFRNFDRVFKDGHNKLEYRFLFADNTYHWMQDSFRLSYTPQGEINGIVGCWIDITEKKNSELKLQRLQKETATINDELRANQEELMKNLEKTLELNKKLEASERFAQQVISSANEGLFVLDKDLRYTAWNPYLEKLTGLPAEKVLGKHPLNVFLDVYLKHPERTSFLERAIKGETIIYSDFHFELANNHSFWSTGSFSPLKGIDEEIIGVIGTVTDITERKATEVALHEQKNLLQSFYDSASFQMGVFELLEDDFSFKFPNRAMAVFFKKTPKDIQKRKASQLGLPMEFINDWLISFKRCIATGTTIQKEETYSRFDGEKVNFLFTFSPIDEKTISLIALDITGMKKAEEERNQLLIETQAINMELSISQKSFKAAQDLARVGMWEYDLKAITVKWSEVMFELLGLDPREPIPELTSFWEMIDPEYREIARENSRNVIELGTEYNTEIKILPKDVPYRWISSIGRPVFNDAGEVEKVIGIYFDITEQKKANEKIKMLLRDSQETNARLLSSEEELKQSLENSITLNQKILEFEQRWQFALEGSENGVWDWNPQTNEVFFSRKMKEMLNYGREEEISSVEVWESKIHPEDKGYVMAGLSNCFTKITPSFETEYRLLGKGNQYLWMLVRGKVVEWLDEEKPVRMIGTLTDITARKQYEVDLANAANYLNKLINTIIDPIFVKDRNHRLVLVNDACCELAGMKREQLLGKTDFDLLKKDKAEALWEIDEWVFKYGEDHVREEILTKPDGEELDILTKKSLYVDSGGDCLLVGILLDITHQKQLEKQLKEQNENLKKINDELDSFVYRTSHDLRSPLASVLGLINISREERKEENRQMYMDLMEKSISRLDRFIHEIINFSKNTRIDVIEEEIILREMIEDILDGLKYMDGYERIEKRIEISQKIPFVSDLFRLKIICNNLISNAIKYSSLSAKAPFIAIKITVNEREAMFDFVDNGVGIAKENVSRVFDMFFRASTASKGSGLGLYIVKEIIQKLKGDISIESEPGEGTTFRVVLPNKALSEKL